LGWRYENRRSCFSMQTGFGIAMRRSTMFSLRPAENQKIEPTDIVQLIEAVYKRSAPTERLWHLSPATLRKRFNALQAAIGLCTRDGSNGFIYTLASLRPGGATHWLQVTEDAGVCASKR